MPQHAPAEPPIALESLVGLFQGTTDAVYAVDDAQRIVFANQAAADLFGIDSGEIAGRFCFEVVAGTDYSGNCLCRINCNTICSVRSAQNVPDYDVLVHPADRARTWVNMGIIAANVEGFALPLAVHIARDLTHRRQLMPDSEGLAGRGGEEAQEILTRREMEIVRLLAAGGTVRQIAEDLVVTPATVRNHIENLMAKLGAHSRLQAAVCAARLGLLHED